MEKTNNELLEQNENKVMREFAKLFNIIPMQIIAHNKSPEISDYRQLYCKLRYENHGLSFNQIAREIGRTSSTVRYSVKHINELINVGNEDIVRKWNKVKDISGFYEEPAVCASA